jgi:hypothetical protein
MTESLIICCLTKAYGPEHPVFPCHLFFEVETPVGAFGFGFVYAPKAGWASLFDVGRGQNEWPELPVFADVPKDAAEAAKIAKNRARAHHAGANLSRRLRAKLPYPKHGEDLGDFFASLPTATRPTITHHVEMFAEIWANEFQFLVKS